MVVDIRHRQINIQSTRQGYLSGDKILKVCRYKNGLFDIFSGLRYLRHLHSSKTLLSYLCRILKYLIDLIRKVQKEK